MSIRLIAAAAVLVLLGATPPTTLLDGVWKSEGYGMVFNIQGPTAKIFQVTTATCVPAEAAERTPSDIPGREATFAVPGRNPFFIRTSGSKDRKLLHWDGSASDIRLDRIARLPAVCEHPTPNTPAGNFEVFARTWAEHYILFDERKANWDEVIRVNRQKVTAQTTPAQLYDILVGMIEPFHDLHTFITAPDLKREFRTARPGTDRIITGDFNAFLTKTMPGLLAITDTTYLKTPLRQWCRGRVQYAKVNDQVGYLRITSFSGYAEDRRFASGLVALQSALDEIFLDPSLQGLVIDVRLNFGGEDPYGLEIASRLATREYLAYTKVARADPLARNQWTAEDPSIVRPSSRPGFRGPVVELIGPITISAGETFTQALMGRMPHVTRLGEPTQGVFSDVLVRKLPNGWTFGLPNEVYRTAGGKTFDIVGIPPDTAIPVFADADVAAKRDPALAKALEILAKEMTHAKQAH